MSKPRYLRTLALVLALSGGLAPVEAGLAPGFLIGMATRIRGMHRRHERAQRQKRMADLKERVEASIERLRSQYPDERRQGVEEILEISQEKESSTALKRLPGRDRLEVVLERMLRDGDWKVRMNAYRSMVALGMEVPPQDPNDRYERVFGHELEDPASQGDDPTEAVRLLADKLAPAPAPSSLE